MKRENRDKIVKDLLEEFPILTEVSFNELNIHDKLMENAERYHFYYDQWLAEKAELAELEAKRERLEGLIYDELRFPTPESTNPHACKNLASKEIVQYYIPRDVRYVKLMQIIERQKVRVEFFELAAQTLNKLGWNMRNFIDNEKLNR
jgi:hypothetical protein